MMVGRVMNMKMMRMRMRMMLIIASIGIIGIGVGVGRVEGMWCVARSDASEEALQRGLDYACAAGADCVPIQENGMCYLPNTLQAHASYAFNSYYQRSNMAPASCDFSGIATLAKTDPSYGSCVYPASPSTAGAGGITSTTGATPTTNPNSFGGASPMTPATTSPTSIYGGVAGGINPTNMGPPIPTITDSKAPRPHSTATTLLLLMHTLCFVLPSLAVV
uniref:DNA-directed RNA polymerase n=1 Tax=Opuntia streptacantha TaxID=393608 RepID=A0A7C8ZG48_OPUST